MKWIDYREKLGIGFNDEQKYRLLKNKICCLMQSIIDTADNYDYDDDTFLEYFITVGENPIYQNLMGVKESFEQTTSMNDLISKYIALINIVHECFSNRNFIDRIKSFLFEELNKLNIDFEIIQDNDGVFIFPKGAKELDDALVSEPLEWLSKYTQTRKEWIDALKDYSNVTEDTASDVADKFRKALERFFQEFFCSSKSLENLKSEYGTYIKSKGVPPEISNNFETLLQSYTSFMNGYAKHHDKTSKNVLEYIMYQTGNIIRLLITLKKEEKDA